MTPATPDTIDTDNKQTPPPWWLLAIGAAALVLAVSYLGRQFARLFIWLYDTLATAIS